MSQRNALQVVHHHPRRSAMTLLECLVAIVLISIASMAIFPAIKASQNHLTAGDERLRAARLAENIIEEVTASPNPDGQWARSGWTTEEFDGLHYSAGTLRDASDDLYPSQNQGFSIWVNVENVTLSVPQLGTVVGGRRVAVTVTSVEGDEWTVGRFVPE